MQPMPMRDEPSTELSSAEPLVELAELSIEPPRPLSDDPSIKQSSIKQPSAELLSAEPVGEPSGAELSIKPPGPLNDEPSSIKQPSAELLSAEPVGEPSGAELSTSADAPRTSSAKLSVESGREGAASSGRSAAVGKRGRGGTIASEHRHGDGERAC